MSYSPFDRNPSGIVFFTNGGTEPVFDSDANFILATGSPGYIKSPNLRIGDGGNIGSVSDPDAISIASNGNISLSQSLVVAGDLVVNGTTTSVNTTNLIVKDTLIELGSGTVTPANDAGIVINRGSSANAFIGWDESADKFIVGTGTFTGVNTGNLTIGAGTLVASTFEGNLTGNASTATTLQTARTISLGDELTGSASFNGSANITINASLTSAAITGLTDLGGAPDATNDFILIYDASATSLKKVNRSNFVSGLGAMSNFTISDGTTTQQIDDGETVTFADGIGAEFVVSATNTITVNSVDSEIVHDNLSGFVANEHINHSSVSITAGNGLTGGGDITTTRTINVVGGDGITVTADEVEVTVDNSTIELSATNGTGAIRVKDGGITFAKLAGAAVQLSSEAFADNDTSLMTSAAIQDKILSYGYSTTTGTVTSVGGTGSVNGITLTGTVTSTGNLTLGGTLANITVSQLAAAAVQTGTEVGATGGSIGDNDTSLLTAAAIINYVEGKNYSTTTGTVTSVATGTGLTGGTITSTGTISIANGGVDTTQLADGAVTEAKRERSYSGVNTSSTASSYLTGVDAATLPITITLPSTPTNGSIYTIKKIDASTNTVTISRSGSQTIDGSTSKILYSQWESISLFYAGGDKWFVI